MIILALIILFRPVINNIFILSNLLHLLNLELHLMTDYYLYIIRFF
jgi:hypothetical protein